VEKLNNCSMKSSAILKKQLNKKVKLSLTIDLQAEKTAETLCWSGPPQIVNT
jgi:hypothetical protein